MEKLEVVSFIPARGGSVRVPRKNIKMLAGKPMMNWTIEASLKSKYIYRTFVSTEDSEIKEIALKAGAEVLDRPKEFGAEDALIFAFHHFVYCMFKEYKNPCLPYICIWLYPTSPLRTAGHIDEAYELYRKSKADFLMSVYLLPNALMNFCYIDEKTGLLEHCADLTWGRDRSRYKKIYHNNGSIYIGRFPLNIPGCACLLKHVQPYIMSREDSVDLNYDFDFAVAEMLMRERIKLDNQ